MTVTRPFVGWASRSSWFLSSWPRIIFLVGALAGMLAEKALTSAHQDEWLGIAAWWTLAASCALAAAGVERMGRHVMATRQ